MTPLQLDARDPLAPFRDRFVLRDGLIYLDGNSLGALPKATQAHMMRVVNEEWGGGLITSWLDADWADAPRRIGDKIAGLIGAQSGEVIVSDSTSINIFKVLSAALAINSRRSVMLTEQASFPTDHYMMQGLAQLCADRTEARSVPASAIMDSLDENVAVLLLTHVHYRTGQMHDMAAIMERARQVGAIVVWDLSHSAGAVEVDLEAVQADFAVGCGYKFLNGGPGAPAYIYVAKRHQHVEPVLSGWFGHARPFAFEELYEPAEGIDRFLCGTPSVLGMAALESGVDIVVEAGMAQLREKSAKLGELMIAEMDPLCDEYGFELDSPREIESRGSQVSYAHENAYAMVQALKAKDVIGDFRTPGIMRFGLTPLYLRHGDIVDAVSRLRAICEARAWDKPEYQQMAAIT